MTFRNAPLPAVRYGPPTLFRGGVEYPQGDDWQTIVNAERRRQASDIRCGPVALWVIPMPERCPACEEKMRLTKAESDARFDAAYAAMLEREGPYVPPRRTLGRLALELDAEIKKS